MILLLALALLITPALAAAQQPAMPNRVASAIDARGQRVPGRLVLNSTGGNARFNRGRALAARLRPWPREALNLNGVTLDGAGVNIALFDSGVSPNYELNGKVDLYDVSNSPTAEDTFGHGTAIAGILVGGGGDEFKSVAPGARLKSYKITYEQKYATGERQTKTSNINIERAVEAVLAYNAQRPGAKIDIINISYGLDGPDEKLEAALRRAYDAGITIVAAAGNDGAAARYPAAYPFIIGVGGINRHKDIFALSNRGAGVDFYAPGQSIFALDNKGGYVWLEGGTSYSAAYISGLCALIVQAWQAKHHAKPTPAQVKTVLTKISGQLDGIGPLPNAAKITEAV